MEVSKATAAKKKCTKYKENERIHAVLWRRDLLDFIMFYVFDANYEPHSPHIDRGMK